jgi:hypothetical protein
MAVLMENATDLQRVCHFASPGHQEPMLCNEFACPGNAKQGFAIILITLLMQTQRVCNGSAILLARATENQGFAMIALALARQSKVFH